MNLQALVSWEFSKDRSWESVFFNLRMNSVFQAFINSYFDDKNRERESFVQIADIKEKIKFKFRRTIREIGRLTVTKSEIMLKIGCFDPYDFKIHQVFYHKYKQFNLPVPPKFEEVMENLVFASYFYRMDQNQRYNHDAFIAKVQALDPDITLEIENYFNFESLPFKFKYITKNIFVDDNLDQTIDMSPQKPENNSANSAQGCSCENGDCSRVTECCPKLVSKKIPYPYRKDKKLALQKFERIIECSDKCSCGLNCFNRVTQQPRKIKLCLFKTIDRGYGIKSGELIKKGTFVLEYTGELLGNIEAGKRKMTRYLFDLNMDRLESGFYTIDAYHYGNLARFINHSCDPNCIIFYVHDCQQDPKTQRLCIFAIDDIPKDTEITIDYCPQPSIPTSDRANYSQGSQIECHCDSKNCRGTIY
jgi:histone-lysine N-methyltransferase SUV39H